MLLRAPVTRPLVSLRSLSSAVSRCRPGPQLIVAAKGGKGGGDKGGKGGKEEKGGKGGKGGGGVASAGGGQAAALVKETKTKMEKSVEVVKANFNTIRTGRANPAMLDRILVDYFDVPTPLKSLCTIITPDSGTLVLQPFEKKSLTDIEKALLKSDIGMTPTNDGNIIRMRVPELTEERRKEMGKQAAKLGEDGKVALRNIRKDAMKAIEKAAKSEGLSEDDQEGMGADMDKLIAAMNKEIDALIAAKQKELMKI